MPDSSTFAITARYLFPISSLPLAGGVLTVSRGRIVAVGENLSGAPPRDLGNMAVLPGLVNAHTHLEFSDLAAPLGAPGMSFTDWIRTVIEHRRAAAAPSGDASSLRRIAVENGLKESMAAGIVALGEIATPGWPREPFETSVGWASKASPNVGWVSNPSSLSAINESIPQAPIESIVFLELLGLRAERSKPLLQVASEHLRAAKLQSSWRHGLSPHAPYTVPFELLRRVCGLSREAGVPLAMHLAESTDELELLAAHSGPFFTLLNDLGAWDPQAIPRGIKPLDYLRELSTAARALVIHGNYLNENELAFLGHHADRMTLVYCPRTHAYFGHGRYSLPQALALGVNVALGTDSRASNPDLSLFEEMRFVAHTFPEVPPAEILCMGTINGAAALGCERDLGSLEVGKQAAFCLVPLSDCSSQDPHEWLFT